mmetsp:Transcript_428/g.792  ORF Transcript_428/g.792 Transcript_428/m.792 type:complete len:91 (-) Transcript_428:265-537(-)
MQNDKIEVKCFNPIPIQPYVDYMGGILQHKRVQTDFVHRASNKPRNKAAECLPKDVALQQKVLAIMKEHKNGLFCQYCEACRGSADELLL